MLVLQWSALSVLFVPQLAAERWGCSRSASWCERHSRALEAWQLLNDLQAVLFARSSLPPPTRPSTHLSARCSSQNIPHTSGPRVFSQTLPLLPLRAVITHNPCVLLFSFLFMIPSPLRGWNHKSTEHTNVIYSHDLEGKRLSGVHRDVPSRNMLFSSAESLLPELRKARQT